MDESYTVWVKCPLSLSRSLFLQMGCCAAERRYYRACSITPADTLPLVVAQSVKTSQSSITNHVGWEANGFSRCPVDYFKRSVGINAYMLLENDLGDINKKNVSIDLLVAS